jgi:serine/threonine-protein kinase
MKDVVTADRPPSLEATGPYEGPPPEVASWELSCDRDRPEAASWELPGGRYRIVGEIARGGMGVVLRVEDASFGRPLAIKVLRSRTGSTAEHERRFLEEAGITGQLQHPGVPPAHDVGRLADGRPFFSMKLIEGRTLADLLRDRPAPRTDLPRFLKIFEQIGQTLAYAHARGIIHRDLKPLNIMVGAFGEVQVMDWGLAKRLSRESPAAAAGPEQPGVTASPATAEETAASEPDTAGSHTQAGQVLGTFAFMAPEQARGEVQALDERCDVFGLGAILCTILTGRPPYRGSDPRAVWEQAREGNLSDAWSRLDECGADADLVELAKSCLAPSRDQRPRHAGEVADAVARYLASVQDRLERARVAQAQAEVQAREERKRRRLAVGLGGAVLLLIGGAAAAGLWYIRDQGQRAAESAARGAYLEREVAAALEEAERRRQDLLTRLQDKRQAAQLLSNLAEWRELVELAQAAWKRADRLAEGDREMLSPELRGRLEALVEHLQRDDAERQLVVELDRIRFESSVPGQDGAIEVWRAAPKLAKAFQGAGFELTEGTPQEMTARIAASPIRLPLIACLDFWALVTRDGSLRERLLEVARRADADPWRDRVRQVEGWTSLDNLQGLADEADLAQQSPQLLAALSMRLRQAKGDAPELLRRALIHHPRDFWLYFELGHSSKDPQEQVGAFRAALAVRPESAYAYYGLGVVEFGQRRLDAAAACYRKAIELEPRYANAYGNLGVVLHDQGQLEEAIRSYRKALELDEESAAFHANLGGVLKDQGKLDEALVHCRRAVELDPNLVPAHVNLGIVLRATNRLPEAIDCFRRATALHQDNAYAWCNLGHALTQQGKFNEALDALRRGHELRTRYPELAQRTAEWVREMEQRIELDNKLPELLRGEVKPRDASESVAVANLCLHHKRRFAAAARFFAAAFAADPRLVNDEQRYNAACAAALAAAGKGVDADPLSEEERDRLRKQARDWLRAELAAWGSVQRTPQAAATMARALQHWQTDPDLTAVREEAALTRFPPNEQAAWREFWAEVAAARQRLEDVAQTRPETAKPSSTKPPPTREDSSKTEGPTRKPVSLTVLVPHDEATLWINSSQVKQTGTKRTFRSSPLVPGKNYYYELKVEWRPDETTAITRKRKVSVTPGGQYTVDLTRQEADDPPDDIRKQP